MESGENKPFGELLGQFRAEARLSQQKLADRLGVSRQTIVKWERGDNLPKTRGIVLELAEYLQLSDAKRDTLLQAALLNVSSTVWYVPYLRNPFFTGREEVLKQLHILLTPGVTAALTQSHAISGLGGIGKTQIAVEYVYRYRNEYDFIFWTSAATREILIADYMEIAKLLSLPEKHEQDQKIIIDAVRLWLVNHSRWLLILDNVDDLALIREFLPAGGNGHILLTTRIQAIGSLGKILAVEKMNQDEGTLFLLRRAKLLATDEPIEHASQKDRSIGEEIVSATDGLPLALDQAGAYIEETKCGLPGYLARYQTYRADLLKLRGDAIFDHPESVTATFSLAFAKVQETSAAAADLLKLFAFLAPDRIPEEFITGGPSDLGTHLQALVNNPQGFDLAIKVLLRYSLIRRDVETNTFTIHRLVQAVIRDEIDQEIQQQWIERALRVIRHSFPEDEPAPWPNSQRYLDHALVCTGLVNLSGELFSEVAELLHKAAIYLRNDGKYEQAEPLFERALALQEQQLGADHPGTTQTLTHLAICYRDQGKYDRAESLYQRALTIRERHPEVGPDHPDTADSLNNLALAYYDQGKYEQAESLYQRALTIYKQMLRPDHLLDTANCLNNLARLYQAKGKYEQAVSLFQTALSMREQKVGVDHQYTAQSLNDLGSLYLDLGQYEQAEPLLQRALSIREQKLGADHRHTARTLDNLATLYCKQGRYEQAEPLYRRALTILERVQGVNHPYTAQTLDNLATLYRNQGRYEQADSLYRRALTIQDQRLGPQHPRTVETRTRYAQLLRETGRLEDAAAQEAADNHRAMVNGQEAC